MFVSIFFFIHIIHVACYSQGFSGRGQLTSDTGGNVQWGESWGRRHLKSMQWLNRHVPSFPLLVNRGLIQKNATFVTAYPEGLELPGVLCVGLCHLKVNDEILLTLDIGVSWLCVKLLVNFRYKRSSWVTYILLGTCNSSPRVVCMSS